MPNELDPVIEDILDDYEDIIFYRDLAYDKFIDCANELKAGNLNSASFRLKDAAYYLRTLHAAIATYDPPSEPLYLMPYVLAELNKREVTYKSICEAWGKDDFEGRVATIAFIDRMRQLLWNEPYQVLWAAKPEEQEL